METILQTLQNFAAILPKKKGIEKNLWVKKFIRKIDYSREEIALALYYKGLEGADCEISASGRAKESAGRNLNLLNSKKDLLIQKDSLRSEKWLPG